MEALQNKRIPLFPVGTEIAVYLTDGFDFQLGTGTLATLFDLAGQPIANPYLVTVAGEFFHRAAPGQYHVKISKAGWNADVPAWFYYVSHGQTTAEALSGAVADTAPVDTDTVYGGNSGSAFAPIKTTWTTIKAFLKTYLDTLYATIAQVLGRQTFHGWEIDIATPVIDGTTYTIPDTTYKYWHNGVATNHAAGAGTKSVDLSLAAGWSGTKADNFGQWFIALLANGNLIATKPSWDLLDLSLIPVDTVYVQDGPGGVGYELIPAIETHDYRRNLLEHKKQHDTDGARWVSGLNSLTIGTGVAGNGTNTFSHAGGIFRDEEKYHTLSNPQTQLRIGYRNGSVNAPMKFDPAGAAYAKSNGAVPQYDNAGVLTSIPVSQYGLMWIYASNRRATPMIAIVGQGAYASIAAAQAASKPSLPGLTAAEWVLTYRVIIRNVAGALQWIQSDPLYQTTSGPAVGGGGISQISAGNVTTTPSGALVSTNQQATNEELDAKKIPKIAAIVDMANGFNTSSLDDDLGNAKIYSATAALTITLETYTDKPEGFQFGIVATGGIVTFVGTFASKSSYTKVAQGDVAYIVRKADGWHVGGVTS